MPAYARPCAVASGRRRWTVVVRGRGGDDRQARFLGEQGQRVVAFIGKWVEGVGQFDDDVVRPNRSIRLASARRAESSPLANAARTTSLAASGEHQPMTVSQLRQLITVVHRAAPDAATLLGGADRSSQAGIAGRVAGQAIRN